MPAPDHHPLLQQAIDEQHAVGWFPMMMGMMTCKWSEIQKGYFKELGKSNALERWCKQILKQLMMIAWDQWADRNNIKHNTMTPAKQRELKALDSMVKEKHATDEQSLLKEDRHLVQKDLDTILNEYDVIGKKQWIESVEQAKRRFDSNHEEEVTPAVQKQREFLQKWLNRAPALPTREIDDSSLSTTDTDTNEDHNFQEHVSVTITSDE